jgi:hypothetical protein
MKIRLLGEVIEATDEQIADYRRRVRSEEPGRVAEEVFGPKPGTVEPTVIKETRPKSPRRAGAKPWNPDSLSQRQLSKIADGIRIGLRYPVIARSVGLSGKLLARAIAHHCATIDAMIWESVRERIQQGINSDETMSNLSAAIGMSCCRLRALLRHHGYRFSSGRRKRIGPPVPRAPSERVQKAIELLKMREERPMTDADIAREIGLSRERVRQLRSQMNLGRLNRKVEKAPASSRSAEGENDAQPPSQTRTP